MSTSQKEIWQTRQGKIKFSVIEKNISISYLKPKLLAKNLREGTKKQDISMLKSLSAQNYGLLYKK